MRTSISTTDRVKLFSAIQSSGDVPGNKLREYAETIRSQTGVRASDHVIKSIVKELGLFKPRKYTRKDDSTKYVHLLACELMDLCLKSGNTPSETLKKMVLRVA